MAHPADHEPHWWFSVASCRGMNRDLWLSPPNGAVAAMARGICHKCPAGDVCLFYGISQEGEQVNLRFGIFGGAGPAERQRLRLTQGQASLAYREESRRLWEAIRGT